MYDRFLENLVVAFPHAVYVFEGRRPFHWHQARGMRLQFKRDDDILSIIHEPRMYYNDEGLRRTYEIALIKNGKITSFTDDTYDDVFNRLSPSAVLFAVCVFLGMEYPKISRSTRRKLRWLQMF